MQPSADIIAALKAQYEGRALRQLDLVDGDLEQAFILTGPLSVEYKKFLHDVLEAKNDTAKLREAVERAVTAQIRFPERAEVKKLFDLHPAWPDQLAVELHDLAGANAEVRRKNL